MIKVNGVVQGVSTAIGAASGAKAWLSARRENLGQGQQEKADGRNGGEAGNKLVKGLKSKL